MENSNFVGDELSVEAKAKERQRIVELHEDKLRTYIGSLTVMVSTRHLYIVTTHDRSLIVCGTNSTLEELKKDYEGAKFQVFGLATEGIASGLVGTFVPESELTSHLPEV